jgi:hypothetical protein
MKLRLSQDEEKVVDLLRKSGALTPSEISVQTLMGPGEMKKVLHDLEDLGYVVLRDTPDSPDGKLVILSNDMQDMLTKKTDQLKRPRKRW